MNMQYYDLVMVAVLVGATVFGFWKGMAWQLASLASLVVSIFVAAKFRMQLAPMFGQQAPTLDAAASRRPVDPRLDLAQPNRAPAELAAQTIQIGMR